MLASINVAAPSIDSWSLAEPLTPTKDSLTLEIPPNYRTEKFQSRNYAHADAGAGAGADGGGGAGGE
ncbi:hypothetical protein K7432_017919 [Basidiobolus ranarum]|uniref:Uncharacterized protein n=1 Tax=Basidiobolus ranarum TaxID=34480 RepID=A0ABR2WCS7_9FUNG